MRRTVKQNTERDEIAFDFLDSTWTTREAAKVVPVLALSIRSLDVCAVAFDRTTTGRAPVVRDPGRDIAVYRQAAANMFRYRLAASLHTVFSFLSVHDRSLHELRRFWLSP